MARDRSVALRLGAAGALVAVIAATTATFVNDDDPQAATTSTTTTSIDRDDLGPEAQELLDLLDIQRETTYHAMYTASSPDLEGNAINVETWQRPPNIRQDSQVRVGGRLAKTTSLVLPDGPVRCSQVGDAPWQCAAAAAGETSRPEAITANAVQQLGEGQVTARSTSIDGRDLRCFSLTVDTGTSEICMTDEGITARVTAGGSSLELSQLDDDVPDEIFVPPASVVGS